ncbi:MAG: WecB/TagA/CpsF family glycosyltransferase [Deltaproteobacteria bacterium]|nr:WecB/TagA/CpsF family glycosyltransferase [Deltaproteobacteria bacterium]
MAFPVANFAGVRVDALTTVEMLDTIDGWLTRKTGRSRHIACMNAYCVSLALEDPALRRIYNRADLAVPDSKPFVYWIRRFVRRECDLLWGKNVIFALAERARETRYTFYLYGGTPEACEGTRAFLQDRFPHLAIVGTCSPPFRPMTEDEDRAICDEINRLRPDIVLVALGTPRQDYWIDAHIDKLQGSVLIAVGAVFDFFSGRVAMAPDFIHEAGFAWLYRMLGKDRKRLWRRYTVDHGRFLWQFARQQVGLSQPSAVTDPRPE